MKGFRKLADRSAEESGAGSPLSKGKQRTANHVDLSDRTGHSSEPYATITVVLNEALRLLTEQTENPQSLLIVLRHRNDNVWCEVLNRGFFYCDHVIYLAPQDLPQPGSKDEDEFYVPKNALRAFLSAIGGSREFDTVSIISGRGTSDQLKIILKELLPLLLPDCSLTVGGFRVTAEQLTRLTSNFATLEFIACTFARGWWKSPLGDKPCTDLRMDSCWGVLPKKVNAGQASWGSLKSIHIKGRERPESLRRNEIYRECLLPRRDYQTFADAWVHTFWATNLEDAHLYDCVSVDCLKVLPPRSTLRTLWIDSGVTPSVLGWVVGNSNLVEIELLWAPGVQLPWHMLKKLKRLRGLRLEESCLNDEDLSEIATYTRLGYITTYYTDLTPQSWPLILSWPGLKQFWGSQELAFETPPAGLPETTELREFVALNTRFPWFEGFLRRYPNVKVVEM